MYLHEVELQFLFLVPVQANEDKTHQERQKQEQEVYLQCKWQVSFQVSDCVRWIVAEDHQSWRDSREKRSLSLVVLLCWVFKVTGASFSGTAGVLQWVKKLFERITLIQFRRNVFFFSVADSIFFVIASWSKLCNSFLLHNDERWLR